MGLSPRVRGNHSSLGWPLGDARSIPACTGEPRGHHRHQEFRQVYPRVYGGTDVLNDGIGNIQGLSPRVRGNPPVSTWAAGLRRSIPACTGEPGQQLNRVAGDRVYPRVYGGTDLEELRRDHEEGLSPRVRGNPFQIGATISASGSIPACTGEPDQSTDRRPGYQVYPRVYGGTPLGRA